MNFFAVPAEDRDDALVRTFRDIERKARLMGKSGLLMELDRLAALHLEKGHGGQDPASARAPKSSKQLEREATERLARLLETLTTESVNTPGSSDLG
jgi:hypothetical protein